MSKERLHNYTVLFEPAEEGGYIVSCPALPGLHTQGDTLDEARSMAKEAILGYLEVLKKDGRPIPANVELKAEPVKETITVPEPARAACHLSKPSHPCS